MSHTGDGPVRATSAVMRFLTAMLLGEQWYRHFLDVCAAALYATSPFAEIYRVHLDMIIQRSIITQMSNANMGLTLHLVVRST